MLLKARGIEKSYAGVKALKGVDLDVNAGEIVAVVGENGAGKSTLMKILSGATIATAGSLEWGGEKVTFGGPLDAQSLGICTIYQELMIVPELSVLENVFLGHLKRNTLGVLDWSAMRREASAILGQLGFRSSLDAKAGHISIAEQQLIEIAKSLSRKSRLLIMDEPTASLSREEVENLFSVVRRLRDQGLAVILITHHLHEIFELCDRLVVLRDGEYVGKARTDEIEEAQLVEMMLGHRVKAEGIDRSVFPPDAESVLEVRGFTRAPVLNDIDLTLRRGEILGIAGLMGAGRTELVRAIYGADPVDAGHVEVKGRVTLISSPRAALDMGVGLAPEDRKTEGLVLSMSIAQNATMSSLSSYCGPFGLRLREESGRAGDLCRRLFVRHSGLDQPVGTLSGGNQQKVVLAKLLGAGTEIYLLDEPTRGIDIGAKEAIFELIVELAGKGASVIVISSAIEELIRLCDTIVCLHRGHVTQRFTHEEFDLNAIMLSLMGRRATQTRPAVVA